MSCERDISLDKRTTIPPGTHRYCEILCSSATCSLYRDGGDKKRIVRLDKFPAGLRTNGTAVNVTALFLCWRAPGEKYLLRASSPYDLAQIEERDNRDSTSPERTRARRGADRRRRATNDRVNRN